MTKLYNKQGGFSLVELSIVIIISGFILAAGLNSYGQYQAKSQVEATQDKINKLTTNLGRFYSAYGRYPCPASFSAKEGDVDADGNTTYGVMTDCYDESVAVGSCSADYCVSETTIDSNGDGTLDMTLRVRKGTVPFHTLKEGMGWDIDEEAFAGPIPFGLVADERLKKYTRTPDISSKDALDVYSNRFTYTLTERQGTDQNLPKLGAIEIKNEHGEDLSANADYVIVSHGTNIDGGYSFDGNVLGDNCSADLPANERENCDNDHQYVSSLRYDAEGSDNQFDDTVSYNAMFNYFLWDIAETVDPDIYDVYNLNAGNVGVGAIDPLEKMHVLAGNMIVDEIAKEESGGVVTKVAGDIEAEKICGYDADSGEDCFDPQKIGGTGLDCERPDDVLNHADLSPHFRVINGINNEKLDCKNLYEADQTVSCPGAKNFLVGITYNAESKILSPECDTL